VSEKFVYLYCCFNINCYKNYFVVIANFVYLHFMLCKLSYWLFVIGVSSAVENLIEENNELLATK